MVYRPAAKEQTHAALKLLLGADGKPADDVTVVDFLRFSVHRGINLNDVWIAERAGRVVWAVLPVTSPGRTALLLAPAGQPRAAGAADVAGTLLDTVCEHLAARHVQLTQALIDPADEAACAVFLGRRFEEMAELLYLQADVRRSFPAPALPDGFDWITYSPDAHATFAATIVESYRESLDCPGLNGLRDIEDVIAGHKASGGGPASFDPSWWFILRERGRPVAVLLLAHTADLDGDAAGGTARLALAVDAHNAPALRLYHRHGLRRAGNKLALMRRLSTTAPAILHDPSTRPVISCNAR